MTAEAKQLDRSEHCPGHRPKVRPPHPLRVLNFPPRASIEPEPTAPWLGAT